MGIATVSAYRNAIREYELVDSTRVDEFDGIAGRHTVVRDFARELVDLGLLTAWQAQAIFNGRASELVLGNYILLDRIGTGGMGKVYKARHQVMGRIVALKVIRRERLERPEAVKRFQREIQFAAQIAHANIVMAYDANQIGEVLFFAMEYVDGIDISQLIFDKGPLPIREACDYTRQAALGLQHAFERGLVHRDIKPSNLLLTMVKSETARVGSDASSSGELQGVIRLLDLGLAKLQDPDLDFSRITEEGLVVGTPDFLAPEQARNASKADIRADLYGLGCTFYYMLTGHSPYGGQTPTEKLLRHAMDDIPDIRDERPEATEELDAIIKRMLAKNPDDRFQTPIDVALALEPLSGAIGSVRRSGSHVPLQSRATPTPFDEDTSSTFRVPLLTQQRLDDERDRRSTRPRIHWLIWVGLAGVASFILSAGVTFYLLRPK